MKACCLSLPVFFGLSALVAAEALPPDAVPVMCAAICGPIVELSSMCSPKRSLGRRLESRPLDRETHLKDNGGRVEENEQIERRFSVIVPAPTTFPPGLLESLYSPVSSQTPVPPASWPQPPPSPYAPIVPSQSPAPIAPPTYSQSVQPPPAQALPSTANNLLPTTPQAAPPTPTSSTISNTKTSHLPANTLTSSLHHTSTVPAMVGSDGNNGQTGGWGVKENAEEKCVCLNNSFNVAEIAGLCASCISMNADTQNNMEVIMSVCGFPPQQYDPDKDSLASNIWVEATRPTAVWAGSVKLNGARSARIVGVESAIGAMGFAVGALMML